MLKNFYIGTALLLFAASLFFGLDSLVHRKSSRFCINKIANTHKASPEWETTLLNTSEQEHLDQILNQKFTYYSKGSQAYVFISEDKRYILKFLKQQKLRANSWLANFAFSSNPSYQERLFKESKRDFTFNACTTAFQELKEETGLIYVHINPSKTSKKITLFDKHGKRHLIPIGHTSFYVQKRAQLIYSRISELMHQGNVESAKNIISSVFSLLDFLGKKGVVDNDPILRKNFGLIDDIAVQIDIGKMRIDPERQRNLAYKREVASITHSFKIWLEKNYPELIEHFDKCLLGISCEIELSYTERDSKIGGCQGCFS